MNKREFERAETLFDMLHQDVAGVDPKVAITMLLTCAVYKAKEANIPPAQFANLMHNILDGCVVVPED